MIPLRDENPSRSPAVVTGALVLINVLMFVFELMLGSNLRLFVFDWAMVPARLTMAVRFGDEPVAAAGVTLLTSMFLHGGWLHLIGNMWYLWIFGDNVEDRLGHLRFLLFYLCSGVVAALLHFGTDPASRVPTLGASGAIAGVLGAYMVAFPRARIITLVPLFPFLQIMALPALVVLGLWAVMQFFSGVLTLGHGTGGGVAWWAHIGGFAFGYVTMRLLGGARKRPERVWVE